MVLAGGMSSRMLEPLVPVALVALGGGIAAGDGAADDEDGIDGGSVKYGCI